MKFLGQIISIGILLGLIVGCTQAPPAEQVDNAQATPQYTDSTVVASLIKKSKKFYTQNLVSAPSLDDYLKQAEEIAVKNHFNLQLAEIYNEVGVRFRNRSEYEQALKFHSKAVEIIRKTEKLSLQADYVNMLAVVYRRMDGYTQALDLHTEAMEVADAVCDSFQKSVALNGLGNVYLGMERYHASIEYFKKSFDIAVDRGNYLGKAINTNNIGEAFKALGEVDSALVYFYASLNYNTLIESKVGKAICFNSLGDAYRLKKDYVQALKYLKQALVYNQQSRDKINVSVSYSILGETYIQINDYKSAIDNLNKGLKIAHEIGSINQIETCARLLSRAYEQSGNTAVSLRYLKKAGAYKDSLLNEESLRHLATAKTVQELENTKHQILMLNNQTALQKERIIQQRKTMWNFALFLIGLVGIGVLLLWQLRLRSRYNHVLMQQRLLRSQMNPHFIFNALSAIQVYILENDMEKSSKFLSDFALLMRQVLKNSQYEYVTLEEEKKMLGYYMELQQLRFVHPFSFQLEIAGDLDENEVLIPPMITQPFVENAIEHGVKAIGEKGEVVVRLFKENECLCVEIADNGIGLKASRKNSRMGKKHESMAIKITNERLEVIRRMSKKKTRFDIIDIQEEMPGESGVLVRIEMPIIKKAAKTK